MVIEDIDHNARSCFLLKEFGQLGACLVIAKDIKLQTYQTLCFPNSPENGFKGFPAFMQQSHPIALGEGNSGYPFQGRSLKVHIHGTSLPKYKLPVNERNLTGHGIDGRDREEGWDCG